MISFSFLLIAQHKKTEAGPATVNSLKDLLKLSVHPHNTYIVFRRQGEFVENNGHEYKNKVTRGKKAGMWYPVYQFVYKYMIRLESSCVSRTETALNVPVQSSPENRQC